MKSTVCVGHVSHNDKTNTITRFRGFTFARISRFRAPLDILNLR